MVLVVILVRVTKFKVVPDSLKGLMERRCWFGDQEVVGGWRWWGSDGEVGMTWPDNNTTNKTTRGAAPGSPGPGMFAEMAVDL